MEDIKSHNDVASLVGAFYQKVQEDDLIGPVFKLKIKDGQWPKHLEKMTSFWSSVLLKEQSYRGNPFSHHTRLDIHKEHFDRWIKLFNATVAENFQGDKADEAIMRADKMRIMFESKLKHIRSNPNQFPIV